MVGILQFSLPRYIYFVFHGLVKLLYLQLNFKTHTHTHTPMGVWWSGHVASPAGPLVVGSSYTYNQTYVS